MKITKYLFLLSISFIFSQGYLDVLSMSNGDVIKGEIIENSINNYVRVELQGGSILTFEYSDIVSITREKTDIQSNKNISQQEQFSIKLQDSSNEFSDMALRAAGKDLQEFRSQFYLGFMCYLLGVLMLISGDGDESPVGPLFLAGGSLLQFSSFNHIGKAGEELEEASR